MDLLTTQLDDLIQLLTIDALTDTLQCDDDQQLETSRKTLLALARAERNARRGLSREERNAYHQAVAANKIQKVGPIVADPVIARAIAGAKSGGDLLKALGL